MRSLNLSNSAELNNYITLDVAITYSTVTSSNMTSKQRDLIEVEVEGFQLLAVSRIYSSPKFREVVAQHYKCIPIVYEVFCPYYY